MIKLPVIRSAVAKLTLAYLAIIMILSLGFSFLLYRLSSGEISYSLRHQSMFFNRLRAPILNDFEQLRLQQLVQSQAHLRANLFLFNLCTLALGGAVSFLLARHTLQPIEDALEAQSRFTADASHELRTPLTAMQTEIEVALRNPKLTPKQSKDLLASNLEEVAKLRALATGLLRLTSQNGKDFVMQPIALEHVADEAIDRMTTAASTKHISIKKNLGQVSVLGDTSSLTELAVILLDNAIKYSNTRSVIEVKVQAANKHGLLSVIDHGRGMAADEKAHIFERFWRADPARAKTAVEADGHGLGLSIAQKIADLHRGSIEVKSKLGQGSTFTIKLPLAKKSTT